MTVLSNDNFNDNKKNGIIRLWKLTWRSHQAGTQSTGVVSSVTHGTHKEIPKEIIINLKKSIMHNRIWKYVFIKSNYVKLNEEEKYHNCNEKHQKKETHRKKNSKKTLKSKNKDVYSKETRFLTPSWQTNKHQYYK